MMKKTLLAFIFAFFMSACTQIVTAPISLAGTAVSTTLDVAGSAGGAVVNTLTGGSDD